MQNRYIERNGELEMVWAFRPMVNGFETYIFCRGTYSEARAYIESEYPHGTGRHHALTEKELEMVQAMGMKVYLAPKFA